MNLLVIEHHATPSLGVVGDILKEKGINIHVLWGEAGDSVPENTENYDGVLILGGAMNALDDERCPYFSDLISLIRDFTNQERPVMGICLGAQLIARAFSAKLKLDGSFEFGFHPITLTNEGREDPVLGHMQDGLNLFQWHTDHYELPKEAVKLACGDEYPNQGYRIGRATYAMQFHFEVTASLVDGWLKSYTSEEMEKLAPGYNDWLPQQYKSYMGPSRIFCEELVGRWLTLST